MLAAVAARSDLLKGLLLPRRFFDRCLFIWIFGGFAAFAVQEEEEEEGRLAVGFRPAFQWIFGRARPLEFLAVVICSGCSKAVWPEVSGPFFMCFSAEPDTANFLLS